ncbi:MAG TPA: hypothetical protein PLD14_00365 [Candidatus Pacearchaeota archaeon]|nr:hypothetical protein [Candidatus Pacearchaeota archaeon]HPR79668.1 hypothetical protein [Candidatus Pacearchaeota archaeon]
MKLDFIEFEEDFMGLDLIPEGIEDSLEGIEDRRFCREINRAFKAGDLHICTEKSYLIIEYDGEKRSFPIKTKECEAIEKSLNAVFNGTARFLVGSISAYDDFSKKYYCICILRFFGKIKEGVNIFQQKLIKSYIPPMENNNKSNGRRLKLSIQRKLTNEAFFIANNRPLFKVVGRKSKQEVFK